MRARGGLWLGAALVFAVAGCGGSGSASSPWGGAAQGSATGGGQATPGEGASAGAPAGQGTAGAQGVTPTGGTPWDGLPSGGPTGGTTGGNPGSGVTPTATATSVRSDAWFTTPSRNIGCVMSNGDVRCDIHQYTWAPPPQPAWCEFDWPGGAELDDGKAGLTCLSDTVLGSTEVLAYGSAIRVSTVVCASLTVGMRCADTRTGHGFLLARETYRIF